MGSNGFTKLSNAARTAKAMKRIAENAINRMRPAPAYGIAVSIDRVSRMVMVRYTQDTDPVPVAMGSIQPSRPGQLVRIEGTVGDRYVSDVMGESVIAGGVPVGFLFDWPGTTIPSWALPADGRLVSTDTYVSLFAELGYRHGGSGSQFALPTADNANLAIITLIRAL